MPMKTKLALFFLLLLGNGPSFGQFSQIGSPFITHFSKSDYQAGTQNWDILEDPRGILYFGNNKGLLEFDGVRWRLLSTPNRTIVRSMRLAADGRIYIGAQDEFGYLEADSTGLPAYRSLTGLVPEQYRGFEDVWKILSFGPHQLFCTQRALFALRDGEVETLLPEGRFDNYFQANERLFLRDTRRGLLEFDGRTLSPVPGGQLFVGQGIAAILPGPGERLLLVSMNDGLFWLDRQGIEPWDAPANDFLREYRAFCGLALADGRYAIGTPLNGLLIVDQAGRPSLHLNKATGLQNNTVLSIYQDHLQNLWLGLDNGIDYAEICAPFKLVHSRTGLEGTGYASILYQDRLFLGTNQGLYYFDWKERGDPLKPMRLQEVGQAKGQVWSLQELGGELLIGHHEGAFVLRGEEAVPLSRVQGAWKFLELSSFPGYAVCGTYSGLLLYRRDPQWTFVRRLDGFGESARVMEQDAEGNLWVSHAYKGLYRVRFAADEPAIAGVDFYNSGNGLPTDLFINVGKVRGKLVFTTPEGLYRYDPSEDRFFPDAELTEVFGEGRNVHRLLEDQSGQVWFSIDEEFGVVKVREEGLFNELEVHYFNQIQDVLVDGFESVFAVDSHHVFIATEGGFVHYDPSIEKDPEIPFGALIREVAVLSKDQRTVWAGGLYQNRPQADLSFSNKDNSFRFVYSAPYYEEQQHLQYRHRLRGFQEDWSDWTTQSRKEYTNLPHGDYSFEVEARNAYGQISAPAVFPFTIDPPWYATTLARIVYLLLALVMIFGQVRSSSRRVEKAKAVMAREQAMELDRKEAEYREEAERSEAEIIRLRNEKLQSDIQHKNSELASATMHLVQKGEILMNIRQDLSKLLPNAASENKRRIKQLIKTLEADARLDDNWEQFELYFDQVHEDFLRRLRERFPALTPKDQKLCAYLRMNLSTKEIAPLMNISVRGVEISRYRLRKKLELETDDNLVDFILKI